MRAWQTIRTSIIGRHVHKRAYAALVLSGCYEEAGDSGRHQVQTGDVVLHQAFEAHLDRFPTSGAVVLNIPLPAQYAFRSGVGRVDDPDAIVRVAEKGDWEAAALLLWSTEIRQQDFQHWADELAMSLAQKCVSQTLGLERSERHSGLGSLAEFCEDIRSPCILDSRLQSFQRRR
jgi:hypothetical protein